MVERAGYLLLSLSIYLSARDRRLIPKTDTKRLGGLLGVPEVIPSAPTLAPIPETSFEEVAPRLGTISRLVAANPL